MFPDLINTPSSNWNERPLGPSGAPEIDTVILHYTGMRTADEALTRLCDAASEVSAHFLIEKDGTAHQLVSPEKRAWHAGVSVWQGRNNLNHTSIGIELVNQGHEFGYHPFPAEQIESLLRLLGHLKKNFQIEAHRFIGHSDVAPARKEDPGELFPWQQLAEMGYGLWPEVDAQDTTLFVAKNNRSPEIASLKKSLSIIGYDVEINDVHTHISSDVLMAFQRHWRPGTLSGKLDKGTARAITAVAELTRQAESSA